MSALSPCSVVSILKKQMQRDSVLFDVLSSGLPSLSTHINPDSRGDKWKFKQVFNHHEKAQPENMSGRRGWGSRHSSVTEQLCDFEKVIQFFWVGFLFRKIRQLN